MNDLIAQELLATLEKLARKIDKASGSPSFSANEHARLENVIERAKEASGLRLVVNKVERQAPCGHSARSETYFDYKVVFVRGKTSIELATVHGYDDYRVLRGAEVAEKLKSVVSRFERAFNLKAENVTLKRVVSEKWEILE